MAPNLRHLRARALKAMFRTHTVIYELSDGVIGSSSRFPMLLLSVVGRKSGQTRTTPLVYFKEDDRYVVVGSDGAARRDPQWWKNLKVDPSGSVRVGRRTFLITAHEAEDEERARLWEMGKNVNPAWQAYQKRTERRLPVVVLTPMAGSA